MSVEELWASSWPGVDFVDASPEDRKLFLDHAMQDQSVFTWRVMKRFLLKDFRDFQYMTADECYRDSRSVYDIAYDFFGIYVDIVKNEQKVYHVTSSITKQHLGDIIEVDAEVDIYPSVV